MGRPRHAAQIARDRRRIADLYLKGELQADIAAALGVNQSTVSRDLKALQKEWLASALVDIGEAKAQELAKIDRLEREYWEAWERSCTNAETVQQVGDAEGVDKITKTSKGQAGDPRFLSGIQWCIDKRCKILGIESPDKSIGMNIDLSELTGGQVRRIADGEDILHVLATPGTG